MNEKNPLEDIIFGLDIGTRNVVGTVGYQADDGFHVIAQCVREHQTRSMLDGQIHDIGRVGDTIREVKEVLEEAIGTSLTQVCIAAAGRVLRTVTTQVTYEYPEETVVTGEDLHTLDLMGIDQAQQELLAEGDNRYKFYCVGYSVMKYYLNDELFSSLEGHKANKIDEIIIVTFLPEDVVDGLYSAVERAGLQVANLTLEPIAAINVAIPENFRMLNIALVDVGASRVRDLFKEATKNAPCIVFIDEIDAIGRSRDSKYGGGNEEREQTLNQLLSEMDGFDSSKGILILGATNRPEILDKALLRPGRFDRRIIVDKPDLKGRVEILKVHSKDVKMDETVDLDAIALATSGAVGSDLANMINEAAINAVKEGREFVSQKDLFAAVEQVLVGKEKKDRIMSKEERRIVSYHEVGHALISALQKNSEPVWG